MIKFKKFQLDNGLKVLVHEDKHSPLVVVNLLYDVGSKDEADDKTGFAHLFEHLMFGGSIHVPDFDKPIQIAGGENNAFTNSDFTNFYNILPAKNIEVAFWLESDRMLKLAFSEKSLEVQKKVVIEEFKETTLNKPYGDLWHKMSSMAYRSHPYKWPTIGLTPDHIDDASLDDVKSFFFKHYCPNNAILSVAGNTNMEQVKSLAEKWFGPIAPSLNNGRSLPKEIEQKSPREELLEANVPLNALFLAFPMYERVHADFPAADLLSDLLSEGKSSRFYRKIVKNANSFSQLYAYLSGTIDPGLFIIDGRLLPDSDFDLGLELIWKEIEAVKKGDIEAEEIQKLKNKYLSSLVYADVSILNKAINLAFYELLGDANLINKQLEIYEEVTKDDIVRVANEILDESRQNLIRYKSSLPS